MGASEALLRHDSAEETPTYPRGGFLIEPERLTAALEFFLSQQRIVAVYEPADPFRNGYNLNVLFESPHVVTVEAVGPGFDASDLQRGDLSPHEAFSVSIASTGHVDEVRLVHRVSPANYVKSVQFRRIKIQRKFDSCPANLSKRASSARLAATASIPGYKPISQTLVTDTVSAILSSDVIPLFQSFTGVGFPLNFSTSFVNQGDRQVYWDIVSPVLKYQKLTSFLDF